MLQHDKRKVRIPGKPAPSIPGGAMLTSNYSPGWYPPQIVQGHHSKPRMIARDTFPGPEMHPSLGPHAAKAYGPDQVILFMEDGKGSGVPVLGRRVPMGYSMVEPIEGPVLNEEPVIGRRSHRLYHNQQQQQQPHQHQQHQQHHMIKSRQHHKSKCAMIMNDDSRTVGREQYRSVKPSQQALSGLQIGHLRKGKLHQSRSIANIPAEAYLDSGQLNWPQSGQQQVGSVAHPVGQHASRRQMFPHQPSAGLLAPAMNLTASSSCSSLCSADECLSCCSPTEQQQQVSTCKKPCCMPSYVPAQCRRACCQPNRRALAEPHSIQAANKPVCSMSQALTTDLSHHLYLSHEKSPQRQGRARVPHQGGSAQRASSSHEICQRKSYQDQQPMRISGRNMLPVKKRVPVFVDEEGGKGSRNVSNKVMETQTDNSVIQIYESLAAELKAKLGDPRLAPILLPPKDYDTLSRRQGRLGDIELRRSTNPKLVGTTKQQQQATSGPNTDKYRSNIEEQQTQSSGLRRIRSNNIGANCRADELLVMESVNECDSARSSGRQSHLDGSLVSRSRSNSSSGLGSISMGAGSGNSSPSSKCSSSEDMHHMSAVRGGKLVTINDSVNINSSNISNIGCVAGANGRSANDNCGGRFSDSGQSESGQIELGSETLLRADNDSRRQLESRVADRLNGKLHLPSTGVKANNHLPAGSTAKSDGSKNRLGVKGYDATLRWKGRVEIPLKVNSSKNGDTYLATKQIIY